MHPSKEITDILYLEEIARARALSPELRLLEGPRLFDSACRVMRDGIRYEHPDADEQTIDRILRERLDRLRSVEAWT